MTVPSALLIAIPPAGVVVGQLWLKLASRRTGPGAKWRSVLEREDFVWWLDWVVVSAVTIAAFLLKTTAELDHKGKSLTLTTANTTFSGKLILLLILLFVGFSVLPVCVNRVGYQDRPPDEPQLRPIFGILLPNAVGAVLFAAVLVTGSTGVGA